MTLPGQAWGRAGSKGSTNQKWPIRIKLLTTSNRPIRSPTYFQFTLKCNPNHNTILLVKLIRPPTHGHSESSYQKLARAHRPIIACVIVCVTKPWSERSTLRFLVCTTMDPCPLKGCLRPGLRTRSPLSQEEFTRLVRHRSQYAVQAPAKVGYRLPFANDIVIIVAHDIIAISSTPRDRGLYL
jgi:hypothetical protein